MSTSMSSNDDNLNGELEQLVAGAKPTLDAILQNRLTYEAGLAAVRTPNYYMVGRRNYMAGLSLWARI